jgi:hypothetical protein
LPISRAEGATPYCCAGLMQHNGGILSCGIALCVAPEYRFQEKRLERDATAGSR